MSYTEFIEGDFVIYDGHFAFVESVEYAIDSQTSAPVLPSIPACQQNLSRVAALDSDDENDGPLILSPIQLPSLAPPKPELICSIEILNIPPKPFALDRYRALGPKVTINVPSSKLKMVDRTIIRALEVVRNPFAFPNSPNVVDTGIVVGVHAMYNLLEKSQLISYVFDNNPPVQPDFLTGIRSDDLFPVTRFTVDSMVASKNFVGKVLDVFARIQLRSLEGHPTSTQDLWLRSIDTLEPSPCSIIRWKGGLWTCLSIEYLQLKVDWLYCVNNPSDIMSRLPQELCDCDDAMPLSSQRQFLGPGDCVKVLNGRKEYVIIDSRSYAEIVMRDGTRCVDVPSVNLTLVPDEETRENNNLETVFFPGDVVARGEVRFMVKEANCKDQVITLLYLAGKRKVKTVPYSELPEYILINRVQDEVAIKNTVNFKGGHTRETLQFGTIANFDVDTLSFTIEQADNRRFDISPSDIICTFDNKS